MSKADSLLKKAAVYERLALYSDRKSFLKALAQEQNSTPAAPVSFPGDVEQAYGKQPDPNRALLFKAQQILQGVGADSNAIGNALLFNKFDLAAIQREISTAMYTKMTGLSTGPQIAELKNIMSQLRAPGGDAQAPSNVATNTQPQSPASAPKYPAIDKGLQEALSRVVTIDGLGLPLKIDGVLGPDTKKAIEAFKAKNRDLAATLKSDQSVLQYVGMLAQQPKYNGSTPSNAVAQR